MYAQKATAIKQLVNLGFCTADSSVCVFLDIAKAQREDTDNNWQALDMFWTELSAQRFWGGCEKLAVTFAIVSPSVCPRIAWSNRCVLHLPPLLRSRKKPAGHGERSLLEISWPNQTLRFNTVRVQREPAQRRQPLARFYNRQTTSLTTLTRNRRDTPTSVFPQLTKPETALPRTRHRPRSLVDCVGARPSEV